MSAQIQPTKIQFAFPFAIAKNNKQFNWKFCSEKCKAFNETLFTAIVDAVSQEKFTEEYFAQIMQDTIKSTYISASKKTKEEGKVKKPVYGFMAFCMEQRPKVKEEQPDLESKKINAYLGQVWRELSDEEKAKYAAPPKDPKEKQTKPKKTVVKKESISVTHVTDESEHHSDEEKETKPAPKEKKQKEPKEKPAKQPKQPKQPKEAKPKEAKLTKTFEKECVNALSTKFAADIIKKAASQFETEKEQEQARTKATYLFLIATKKAKGSIADFWKALTDIPEQEPEKFEEVNRLFEVEDSLENDNWETPINFFQNIVLDSLMDFIEEQCITHLEQIEQKPSNDLLYYHLVGLVNHIRTLGFKGVSIDEIIDLLQNE